MVIARAISSVTAFGWDAKRKEWDEVCAAALFALSGEATLSPVSFPKRLAMAIIPTEGEQSHYGRATRLLGWEA